MATGTRPLAAVRLRVDRSPGLERIISKCLEADRELRYQHASDIRTDLQRLKRDTGSVHVTTDVTTVLATAIVTRWKMTFLAVAAVLAFSVAGYAYLHRAPALSEKDSIVLADFENRTGDPVFDDTLRQGLSVELQQSPFLSLISDRQVQQQLALMGQPKEARLTSAVALQVCERTASAVVLEGAIASLGSQYVLSLRARNCNTGTTIDEEQVQVAGETPLDLNSLPMIWKSASRKIHSSYLLTSPFFAHWRHWHAASPQTASSGCKSLSPLSWQRTASTSIISIWAVCTRAMCAAPPCWPPTGIRKRPRSF
jgi:hypothetical protein